jgi:hypothetical protein
MFRQSGNTVRGSQGRGPWILDKVQADHGSRIFFAQQRHHLPREPRGGGLGDEARERGCRMNRDDE